MSQRLNLITAKEREKFIAWLGSKGLKDTSIKNYLFYYDKFEGSTNLTQLKVTRFINRFQNNHVVRSFINNYRSFFLTSEDMQIDPEQIRSLVLVKRTGRAKKRIPKFTTLEQIEKIEPCMNSERDRIMLVLSFHTGIRLGGLLGIRVYSFNWDEWLNKRKAIGKLKVIEKGDKERTVLVPAWLMERLEIWISEEASKLNPDPHDPLFNIGPRRWEMILERASRKALGYRLNPHSLRHGFGVNSIEKGLSLLELKELMGHASVNTTQLYTQISRKDLEEKFSKLFN